MKNKQTETKSRSGIGLTRHLISGVLCLAVISLICSSASAQNLFAVDAAQGNIDGFTPNGVRSTPVSGLNSPTLPLADRIAYQRSIEEVYWRHRIWPKENSRPKPSLDEVMSVQQIEKKVEDYLRDSQALEAYWQKPISSEQLQAEMERMARDTKQPEVLRELFEALGNDPFVIAECLARSVLTERLMADLSAHDKGQRFDLLQMQAAGSNFSITTLGTTTYVLPEISNPDVCLDNTWTATTTTNAPDGRTQPTAVWTGSEMIVWGGQITGVYVNTGGRYNPSTDSWTATSITNAPVGRWLHTAVWTGSEMIVWGGLDTSSNFLNTGGRYNPSSDSWTATSITNAPEARYLHTAVWTGSEMIVWGGQDDISDLNTGGRYNPSSDSWTPTSTTGAPCVREQHTAVWSGSAMIVWGGLDCFGFSNTGGRYNPGTDSWTPTSTTSAPGGRTAHTAVWTGGEMIVWGGYDGTNYLDTGGRYNPSTNSWTATSTTNAPEARYFQTAVWTGSQMIVWGGYNDSGPPPHWLNTGGRYNPSSNSWTATSIVNAPDGRIYHTAVWTGSEMIIWGGDSAFVGNLNTGGRYCAAPTGPTPTPTATPTGTPAATATPAATPTPTSSATPPSAPTANPATLVASSSFTANWSSISGASGYRLDVSTNSSFSTHVTGYQNLNVGHVTTRGVTGLNATTTYYYRVRAYNGGGTSGNSNTISVTTLNATGAPVVTTNPATNVVSFSATLNGSVDPHGLTTSVHFQYGTTTSYGSNTASQSFGGSTYQNVIANISGLSASTTYHFRLVATNSSGTRYGSDRTFTTLSATGAPVVVTKPATNVASFSATPNGSVDPHGLTTSVYFQYGTTTSYGSTTGSQTKIGNTYQSVSANISGLAASTTYHFRIVATNSSGTRYGSDRTFTTLSATGPPVVITSPATSIASFSATLNGSVDPHGLTTTVYFQYGATTSYGLTTGAQSHTGNTYLNISANISGLSASTTYHFRIVATNNAGTSYGGDRTFTALSATGPPVVVTNPATSVASSSATLNGAVDPHGLTTSVHFQYGTTTSYGLTTGAQSHTGNTYLNISANISGLSASTTYHFRIVATNSAGTSYGGDREFTTP